MKLVWIKFYGIYGDCEHIVGHNGVSSLTIEHYSPEPYCSRSRLQIVCESGVNKIRDLEGANYDFQESKQ